MKRIVFLSLVLVSVACVCIAENRKVPSELVRKISSYDYRSNSSTVIRRFFSLCYPDSQIQESDDPVLSPITVDLDGESHPEVLALIGWNEHDLVLSVFKKIEAEWFLIFAYPVHVWYNPPELKIANNNSPNKVFYIRQLYGRGSGIYSDGYEFFKLIDGKIIKCFDVVNEAHMDGWGLNLNQSVETSIMFSSTSADEFRVRYSYSFYPGAVDTADTSGDSRADIPFVNGDRTVYYQWDSTRSTYKQKNPTDEEGLTESQIRSFTSFGNDSLFISSFRKDIKKGLDHGTKEQKRYLKFYLEKVQADGKCNIPSDSTKWKRGKERSKIPDQKKSGQKK